MLVATHCWFLSSVEADLLAYAPQISALCVMSKKHLTGILLSNGGRRPIQKGYEIYFDLKAPSETSALLTTNFQQSNGFHIYYFFRSSSLLLPRVFGLSGNRLMTISSCCSSFSLFPKVLGIKTPIVGHQLSFSNLHSIMNLCIFIQALE